MNYKKSIMILFMVILPVISLAQFSTFVPSQYKQKPTDFSILERSLKKREAKGKIAYENLERLKYILGCIKTQLNDDACTQKWFSDYSEPIIGEIENHIEIGNLGIAGSLAEGYIKSVPTDARILKMIQITNEYREAKQYVREKYWKGEITLTAYDCWLNNNPCWRDGRLPSNSFSADYHWHPSYIIANSMNIDDLCNYIKNNTSNESEYYDYACKYAQMKKGSIEQELIEYIYLSKTTYQKQYNLPIINPYMSIIPLDKKDLRQFVINLVNKRRATE